MTFRKRALYVNYLKIYYSYYVYTMKKYAYCFGCDGKFGASDGIASARRSSYFDLINDPDVSSEDLLAVKHFYTWNRKPHNYSTLLGLLSISSTGIQYEIRR